MIDPSNKILTKISLFVFLAKQKKEHLQYRNEEESEFVE